MNAAPDFGTIDNSFLARSVGLLNPVTPATVEETSTVSDVLAILQSQRIGCVVVTNAKGELTGIFTERDIVLKVLANDVDFKTTTMSKLMTKEPKFIQMDTSMAFSLNLMSNGGYRHLPIVDDSMIPVGIVSIKDIVDYLVQSTINDIRGFVD